MKVLILAGGFGKRLRPLTLERPKPLVEVGGKPITEWQILWLKKFGINEIIISAGYLKEKFLEILGSGKKLGVKIFSFYPIALHQRRRTFGNRWCY